jgi:hypothetical protein
LIFDRTRYLDLSGIDTSELSFNFIYYLDNLIVVRLSHCNIKDTGDLFLFLSMGIHSLDISHNKITTFKGWGDDGDLWYTIYIQYLNLSHNRDLSEFECHRLHFLEVLDLSHTSLSFLEQSCFSSFGSLKNLNISFTKISNFHGNLFPPKLTLDSLDLLGLSMDYFPEDFFCGLTICQHLYTDRFELCCPQIRGANIPDHTCHAPDDAISSCFDLLGVYVQHVLLWVVAVLAVVGNITVIVYRVIWDKSVLGTGYGLVVTNLGISDLIMGIYLFIIAGTDHYYRDVYVLYDKMWRESSVCRLAEFLVTLSCETSTFFVFLITMDSL